MNEAHVLGSSIIVIVKIAAVSATIVTFAVNGMGKNHAIVTTKAKPSKIIGPAAVN